MKLNDSCIFCKIIKGEIPSEIVWQDSDFLIFKDIQPQAKLHYLVIPKEHFASLEEMPQEWCARLGNMLKKIPELSDVLQLKSYRVVINQGADAGQTVFHLHIHILGGEKLNTEFGK